MGSYGRWAEEVGSDEVRSTTVFTFLYISLLCRFALFLSTAFTKTLQRSNNMKAQALNKHKNTKNSDTSFTITTLTHENSTRVKLRESYLIPFHRCLLLAFASFESWLCQVDVESMGNARISSPHSCVKRVS